MPLDRASGRSRGGESQRIRLATQIGSGLMGVLYICDEPTIGLHPADDYRLIETLKRLRDLGNTCRGGARRGHHARRRLYHRYGAGGRRARRRGRRRRDAGRNFKQRKSLTGQYLSGAKAIPVPEKRRHGNGKEIVIKGARQNNLKNIDVTIPLGKLVCITGVSGSGKSTLINEVLYRKLAQVFYRARRTRRRGAAITGIENIDKVIDIDQSPIGRTPRSNPATYTGAFTPIRELFATAPEARLRGYEPGAFPSTSRAGAARPAAARASSR